MLQFGFTRNKDGVVLRLKIDKRNKRPPLALENLISARALIRAFTVVLLRHGDKLGVVKSE